MIHNGQAVEKNNLDVGTLVRTMTHPRSFVVIMSVENVIYNLMAQAITFMPISTTCHLLFASIPSF